ncbi:MAG: dihydroorotate dehydrogenase, partial [Nanoarchaeota archaeon]
MDLTTNICGIKLKNPTILASGILGVTAASLKFVVQNGAGAVTIKSITKETRKGHSQPIVHSFDNGMLNAVGYSNPGYEKAIDEFSKLSDVGAPVIASIVAKDADEFSFLTKEFVNRLEFDALEIPLSCPHTPGFGTMAGHSSPEATSEITKSIRKETKLPLIIKLSPNVPNIGAVAKAAEDAGADAICAVNTAGPGMAIDVNTGKKMLGFGMGGISGPALKPLALRTVYDIYDYVKIPIIGTGGVSNGDDALQMIMAGATAVGIGTAVVTHGINVFSEVCKEMKDIMEKNNYSK